MNPEIPLKDIPTKALVVESPGAPFILRDIILDEVRADEVLVEIKYTGLCHTDLVVQHGLMPAGEYPAILGHEGAGVVRRVGHLVRDKTLREGQHVLLSFNCCRKCSHCLSGSLGSCPHMTAINFAGTRLSDNSSPARLLDGRFARSQFFGQSSFSKLTVVSENSIVKCDCPESDLSILAPLGCGYQTGAGTVLNVLEPKKSSTLAIFGMGAVGLAALMAAKSMQVQRIVAVDILSSKLEIARSLGATNLINSQEVTDVAATLTALGGADNIIDTTGLPNMIEAGISALCHAGTMALVGVPRPNMSIKTDPLDFLLSCKTMIGVIEGRSNPAKLLPELIQLYQNGSFPMDKLGKEYPVQSIDEAIKDLKAGLVVKPILSWEGV